MRTFVFVCGVGFVMAKKEPEIRPAEEATEPVGPEVPEDDQPNFYDKMNTFNYYMKHIWEGCYQGLYGMGRLEARPADECLGEWIADKTEEVMTFYGSVKHDFWSLSYEESMQIAYDQVGLFFLNDEYCLFRHTL